MTCLRGLPLLLLAAPALAQEPEPTYFQQPKKLEFHVDAVLREEWTWDITGAASQDRFRGRALPRLEAHLGDFTLGVGGDFNYSTDENTDTDPPPTIVRDNYKSRSARLDLAFARFETGWLRIEAGRFAMPVELTEMIWDHDLRPQGAALTLTAKRDEGAAGHYGLTLLASQGAHVFDDHDTRMLLAAGEVVFPVSTDSKLQILASFVKFLDLDLEPKIRRQNTRVAGALTRDYGVVDVVARIKHSGAMSVQLIGDYCWNLQADDNNKGLWLALVLGSTETARARFGYTYAHVDKDATLAAYGSDDFFWVTGWEGHRADLGIKVVDHVTAHAIGQLQRFKDAPNEADRDDYVKRLRVEVRIRF